MDALGNPVHFLLTGGNIFDASVAVDLLSEVKISGSNILGDKAYGTNSIRTYITEQRASYTIPPKSNVIEPWFCDFHTYKERHLIEVTWTRADMDILCGYFGNTVSPDRGKPTNGEFIARIANVVRQRMREAA